MKKRFLSLSFFLFILLNIIVAQPPPPPGDPSTAGGANAPVGADIGDAAIFLIVLSLLYGCYYVYKYINGYHIAKNTEGLK